jgi:hypothetical protein
MTGETDPTPSNTAPKQQKPPPGKPFVKGDSRINRKGRPKTFDAFRALSLDVLAEPAKGADGQPIIIDGHVATNVEMIVRSWMKDGKRQQALIEAAFGKVPQQVDVTSGGESLATKLTDEERVRRLMVLAKKAQE